MFEKHFGWRKKCTQQQLKCETILMEFCHYNLLGTSSNLNNVTIRNMFYISYTNDLARIIYLIFGMHFQLLLKSQMASFQKKLNVNVQPQNHEDNF